jgi:prepilin-type N-terminal cleavage/methylation domain-containing protein
MDTKSIFILWYNINNIMVFIKRRAFTLIELLVVIAIIGLLSTVAVVATSSTGKGARNQKRKADLVQISKALELYYSDFGSYPSTASTDCPYGGYCGNCSAYASHPNVDVLRASPASCRDFQTYSWVPGITSCGYMASLPVDPTSGKTNPGSPDNGCRTSGTHSCYLYRSDGTNYALFAYCTPEGTILSSDPFYSPGAASGYEYKLTNNAAATSSWF